MNEPNLKDTAYKLHLQNIASIPIIGSDNKVPPRGLRWRDLTSKKYDQNTIEDIYSKPHKAIAVLGGYISSGLEILDVDLKNSRDPNQLWVDLRTNIAEALPEFSDGCTIARTVSGGYHIYYSCQEIEGNKKLAYEVNEGKRTCTIETRGDGGYALTCPSGGYELIQGSIDRFAYKLEPGERDILHEVCRMFDETVEDEHVKNQGEEVRRFVPRGMFYIRNPFEDFNQRAPFSEIQDLILSAGFEKPSSRGNKVFYKRIGSNNPQGGNWHHQKRLFYPFTGNSLLGAGKAYWPATMLRILRFGGDGGDCFKWLVKNGYGVKIKPEDETFIQKARTQLEDGKDRIEIKKDLKESEVDPERIDQYLDIAENRMIRAAAFWEENDKGVIKVDVLLLKYFLQNQGFKLFETYPDDPNPVLVRCDKKKHTIKEVSIGYVKSFLEEYLNDEKLAFPAKTRDDVLKELIKSTGRIFNVPVFEWIDKVSDGKGVSILQDTPTYSYMFFRNHIIKISAAKPEIISYDSLDSEVYVWEKNIINREVPLINVGSGEDLNSSEYFRFIKRLVGMGPETDKMDMDQMFSEHENAGKLRSFITAIGYLCHRYNDRKRSFSVILAEDIEDPSMGGGTGKGIFLRSLTYAREAVYESGKTWDPKKDFAFQKWKPGTHLYLIDDVTRKFDFESLYSFITDFGNVQKKYQEAITIPFDEKPKFVLTTNFGDMAEGKNPGERRRKMLLVGKYYGPHFTPFQEFGHNLFDEWEDEQWNLFYNVVFKCISTYLAIGFRDFPESDNLKTKTFLQQYGIELFEFFGEITTRPWPYPRLLKEIVDDFHDTYKRKDFSSQSMSIALQRYCDLFDIELNKKRVTKRGDHTNRVMYSIFGSKTVKTDDLPF